MTTWIYCPQCGWICKEFKDRKQWQPCKYCGGDFLLLEPENADKSWDERQQWIHDTYVRVIKKNPKFSKAAMAARVKAQNLAYPPKSHSFGLSKCPKCGSTNVEIVRNFSRKKSDKYCTICYHKF